ncbi:MAG: glycosyl transferase family 2, partial [Alphaproteobacteria bacterium]|nr:glycosyl transferase family 2 [Alphaproteobacteria bacterium]
AREFMAGGGEAGYFRFRLDDDDPRARRLERMVAWRNRTFGLPYGDQGLLVSRRAYDRIGGFRPLPLFEDVDIVRRLGRASLRRVEADAITSAGKWRRGGYLRRSARNLFCLSLYLLGVKPAAIERIYR